MGSLPPVPGGSAPASAATAPTSAPAPEALVLWVYVDDAQRHELQAGMRKGEPLEFFVREVERGNPDPAEAFEWAFPIQGTWESRVHHLALEERLTLLGRYQRQSVGTQGWRRVAQGVGAKRLDLEPLDAGGEFGATRVHYYGSRSSARSVLLLETPTHGVHGERVRLARLDFDFPDAGGGTLRVLHPRLPVLLARSVLAGIHLDLASQSMEKVVALDRSSNANAAWWRDASACVRAALARLQANALGKGLAKAPS